MSIFIWRLRHAATQDHGHRSESRAPLAELKPYLYGDRLYLQRKPHETIAAIGHEVVMVRRSMMRSATLATNGLLGVSTCYCTVVLLTPIESRPVFGGTWRAPAQSAPASAGSD